jgi:hypothetical protein
MPRAWHRWRATRTLSIRTVQYTEQPGAHAASAACVDHREHGGRVAEPTPGRTSQLARNDVCSASFRVACKFGRLKQLYAPAAYRHKP